MASQTEILISAAPCLMVERKAWLTHLLAERRMAEKTLDAYERDLRQFCVHMTHYLGRSPKVKDFANLKPLPLRGY